MIITEFSPNKPESDQENKTHKIFWHTEIQMDHSIQARRPDLVLINEKKMTIEWILQSLQTTKWS